MKIKLKMILVFSLLLISFASSHILEDESIFSHGMMGNISEYGFMGIFAWLFMLLVLVVLVLSIILLIKQLHKPSIWKKEDEL